MSSSSDSEEDQPFSTARLRALLKTMKQEIDAAVQDIRDLVPTARIPLTQTAARILGIPDVADREEALRLVLQMHTRDEARLTLSGSQIRLLPSAADLLGLPADRLISWDKVWKRIPRLFAVQS